jgi:hypothetical protein
MAQDPLANLMTLPDLGNIQNSNQPLVREMPQVNEGITYNPTPIYTPYIPNGAPDAVNINDHIVGNEQDGPNPGAKRKDNGTMDFVKSVNSYIGQADTWAKDEYKYGRAYSYGAGWKNTNYERYYSSPQFKNLGFSPYRNNEAVYNDKSSWWDDFNRMRGQWMGLAWNGVKSAGVGELFGSADDSADSFEKAMSIGSSTQKGVGAFMTNLTLNSAYTLGIMGEIAVENLALGVLDVATFGGSGALHGAALAKQAFSAGKLFEGVKGTYSFLKELKNAEKARDFFNAAKAGETATKFAKWVNPLEHTTEFVTNLAKNTSSFDKLGSMAKTARGFSSFYKDLREIELAHSEAKMEGATGSHEYHQQLIDEYYDKNGMMPDGQAAQDIYDRSQSVRTGVTLANDFVIYGSNKIAFGKLLDGFNPVGAVTKELGEASLRNIGKVAAKDVLTKGAIEATELTLGKKVGTFLTSSAYVPWSRTYLAGNLAEALQENAQDVIQDYQKARHDRLDQDPTQAGYWSAMNDLGGALGKQWSGQGLETFMSGFLMGSIAGGAQGALMGGFQKIQEFKNKDQFDQAKVQRQEHENAIINAVNSLAKDGINYGQHNAERVATVKNLADEQDKAADNNNAYNFNNNKDELAAEHFHTLESNGKLGLFTEHLDDMLSLKDGELAEAYNKPVAEAKQVRKRLNDLKDRAEQYSLDYKAVNDEFVNPHNPSMFNPKKNPELYNEVKMEYDAHNEAVKQLLFSITASKRVAGRMVSTFDDVVNSSPWLNVRQGAKALTNAAGADVSLLLDNFQRESETEALRDEIEALNQGTPAQKAQAKIKQEKLNLLEAWAGSLSNFNKEINSQTRSLTEAQKAANINKSKVREGAVIKEAGKDVEYKVKKVIGNTAIVEDKDGKTLNIDRDAAVIVKESTKAAIYEEGDTLTEAMSMLEDSFNEYAKYLAKTKGGIIMDKELKKTFDKIKDFYILERDSQKFVQAINALNNPEYFKRYTDISKRSDAIRKEQYTANMLKSYNKFIKLMDDNKFLNDLFDIGVFIMPEDVETYKTKPRDVTFYDTVNKEIVKRDSDKYKKIITVIEKYEKSAGIVTEPVKPAAPAEEAKPTVIATPKASSAPVPTTKTPITPTTPVAEIAKLGTLKDKLIAAYKKAGEEKDSKLQMLGGTDEEIMATNTFKEFLQSQSVINMMDAFNRATGRTPRAAAPAEVIVPNTPATDWSSLITSSTSEKELDKVMDQINKAGAMSPELLGSINMKREGLTKTTTAPASDIEAKKQKIVDLRAEEQAEYAAMPDPNNAVEKQKIYDKYDELLTPLLNEVKADIVKRIKDLENAIRPMFGGNTKYVEKKKELQKQLDEAKAELAALENKPAVKKEPGVQAEISFEEVPETEQVTDAEFNEVLRLATFFVENPKEPGTVGDAASKFPKLYQVLKAIEQERYDAIEALNDKPDGTPSLPRKALARTKNKIDATYDKQVNALRPGAVKDEGLTEVDGILVPEFMAKEFADVFTLQDLDNLLMQKLLDFSLGLDSQYIDELRTRLTQELMKKISFNIIEQGSIIIDEKGQAFYVTKKTKNQIKLRSFDLQKMTLGTEEKTVTKATLAKKVKLIYSKNMEIIGTTEETTPQEVEESKKLIDTISEIDSNQAIADDYKNATGASEEDPINELTSLIKSCEE